MRFNAVRNVKEAFQEENSLVQKLESTQRKEEDQRGIREGKTKYLTFFILKSSKRKLFKTIIVTTYCVLITQAM